MDEDTDWKFVWSLMWLQLRGFSFVLGYFIAAPLFGYNLDFNFYIMEKIDQFKEEIRVMDIRMNNLREKDREQY